MSIRDIMQVVKGRQQAPNTVNLRVIPIDLRDDKDDRDESERECESRNQRVGAQVKLSKSFQVCR